MTSMNSKVQIPDEHSQKGKRFFLDCCEISADLKLTLESLKIQCQDEQKRDFASLWARFQDENTKYENNLKIKDKKRKE